MITLKESLQQRQMADPPFTRSCERAEKPVRSLQIHLWGGKKKVLPWSQFQFADFENIGGVEQLVLLFARHEVVLQGTRLAQLLPEIAKFHLECVRDAPPECQAEGRKDDPVITSISVRSLANSVAKSMETS